MNPEPKELTPSGNRVFCIWVPHGPLLTDGTHFWAAGPPVDFVITVDGQKVVVKTTCLNREQLRGFASGLAKALAQLDAEEEGDPPESPEPEIQVPIARCLCCGQDLPTTER